MTYTKHVMENTINVRLLNKAPNVWKKTSSFVQFYSHINHLLSNFEKFTQLEMVYV